MLRKLLAISTYERNFIKKVFNQRNEIDIFVGNLIYSKFEIEMMVIKLSSITQQPCHYFKYISNHCLFIIYLNLRRRRMKIEKYLS